MSFHALGPAPEQIPTVLRQHEELIGIVEARDEAAFALALRAHVDGTHRR
jgi:DNA-binding GntR family transcriptional regulator